MGPGLMDTQIGSKIVLAEDVPIREGRIFTMEGANVEIVYNEKEQKIVQASYWVQALKSWIDATSYVLDPENKYRHDFYLQKIQNILQNEKDEKKQERGWDYPL